jgi:hypothetical protein
MPTIGLRSGTWDISELAEDMSKLSIIYNKKNAFLSKKPVSSDVPGTS